MQLSNYAKHRSAQQMYVRGKQFTGSAILLERSQGDGYVVRHLICQGIELILKGILLLHDFDKYDPLLHKKKHFGHSLCNCAREVCSIYGLKLHPPLNQELQKLDSFFNQHLFRYGKLVEVFFPPDSIPFERSIRRLAAMMRKFDRQILADPNP